MDETKLTNNTKVNEDFEPSAHHSKYSVKTDNPSETHEDSKNLNGANQTILLAGGPAIAISKLSGHYGEEMVNRIIGDNETKNQVSVNQVMSHDATENSVAQANGKQLTGHDGIVNPVSKSQNPVYLTTLPDHDVTMTDPSPANAEIQDTPPPPRQSFVGSTFFSLPEDDHRSDKFRTCDFTDSSNRSDFLRKVYGLVLLQLIVVALFAYAASYDVQFRFYTILFYKFLLISAAVLYVLTAILTHFGEEWRHRFPYNLILLLMFTVSVSLAIAVGCAYWDGPEYFLSLVATAIILVSLMVCACSNKYAMWYGFALCILICLLVLGAAYYLYFYKEVVSLYLCATGVLFYNMLVVHSTSVMASGKHRYGIMPRDCVFAVACVYVDIWNFAFYKKKILRFV